MGPLKSYETIVDKIGPSIVYYCHPILITNSPNLITKNHYTHKNIHIKVSL